MNKQTETQKKIIRKVASKKVAILIALKNAGKRTDAMEGRKTQT